MIVRVDVAELPEVRLTVLGLAETIRPRVAVVESETGPEKLLKLVNARVEVVEDPGRIVRLEGLAERKKSDTEGPMADTVVVRELMSFPL
jgi:hypothetical protein